MAIGFFNLSPIFLFIELGLGKKLAGFGSFQAELCLKIFGGSSQPPFVQEGLILLIYCGQMILKNEPEQLTISSLN